MKAFSFPLFVLLALTQCSHPVAPGPLATRPVGTSPNPAPSPTWPAAPATKPAVVASPAPSLSSWKRGRSYQKQALLAGAELHEFTATRPGASAEVTLIRFDSERCAFRVLDQPSASAGGAALTGLMRQAGAVAGVNGGFFHPDFSPLGLMVSDGRRTGQFLRTNTLVSGSVLMISQEPYLVWNPEFLGENGVSQLLQAGPRLVDGGYPISKLNRSKSATRTFVATDGKRQWALGTVRSVSLGDLGDMLASDGFLPGMKVQRALNLDGGRSSALYARAADGRDMSRPGWSTVRNYLAVVPR